MANASSVTSPFSEKENAAFSNNTDYYYGDIHMYDWAFRSLILLSCLGGLVGNSVVIWLLSFGIKRNPFTTYILNLAVADFGTLLGLSINVMAFLTNISLAFSLLFVSIYFTYSVSLYFLTAISLERCLSVLFPIWYRCHRPGRSSAIVSSFLWVIPGFLVGPLLVYDYLSPEIEFMVVNTIVTLNLLIFTPIVVASTLIMSVKICCSSQRRQPPRLYITILVTLLFFLIFAVPLNAAFFVVINTHTFIYLTEELSFLLASVNSSINPVIYYFVGRNRKKNREPLKAVLKRAFGDEEMCQGGT